MPRTPGTTIPTQFRLKEETLADLDAIASHLGDATRADAVRYAARQIALVIQGKTAKKKTSRKSANGA